MSWLAAGEVLSGYAHAPLVRGVQSAVEDRSNNQRQVIAHTPSAAAGAGFHALALPLQTASFPAGVWQAVNHHTGDLTRLWSASLIRAPPPPEFSLSRGGACEQRRKYLEGRPPSRRPRLSHRFWLQRRYVRHAAWGATPAWPDTWAGRSSPEFEKGA